MKKIGIFSIKQGPFTQNFAKQLPRSKTQSLTKGTFFLTKGVLGKDYISGCGNFSLNSQSVSFLQAYLLLELISSALLAETGGKCPLVLSGNFVIGTKSNRHGCQNKVANQLHCIF